MTTVPDDIADIIKSFLCKCVRCENYDISRCDLCYKCYVMPRIEYVIRRADHKSWFEVATFAKSLKQRLNSGRRLLKKHEQSLRMIVMIGFNGAGKGQKWWCGYGDRSGW